jgi:hypothetical protein
LSKTESAFRLSGAFQSNSPQPVKRVLETCASSQSVQTHEDEPFKSNPAIHNLSILSAQYAALTLVIQHLVISGFGDFRDVVTV